MFNYEFYFKIICDVKGNNLSFIFYYEFKKVKKMYKIIKGIYF